jgi:hypothetical protein
MGFSRFIEDAFFRPSSGRRLCLGMWVVSENFPKYLLSRESELGLWLGLVPDSIAASLYLLCLLAWRFEYFPAKLGLGLVLSFSWGEWPLEFLEGWSGKCLFWGLSCSEVLCCFSALLLNL